MIPQTIINNQNSNQRHILDPYRTLGCFVSGKLNLSQTQPISFAVPTNNSYKIYSDTLAIKVVSPPLSGTVKSVLCYNQYSYVRVGDKLIKMKYHHIVKQWSINQRKGQNSTLMKFDNIILLGQGNKIYVIDEKQPTNKQLQFYQSKQSFIGMIHPVTYINKVAVFNKSSLTLINPISQKTLYEYPNLKQYINQNQLQIVTAQASKLVNIIALSLSNGQIVIFNLKKDQIVFKLKLKLPAITIAFCDQQSMMATSDQAGNVVLWDLQKKKILYKFQQFIQGPIDSLVFVPGHPVITCGSSAQNCIKQLRINLEDNRILTLFRQRVGITQPIQNITLLNNSQVVLSSKSQSMYTSLYSHTNNFKLNRVLDSSSPYHIISRHFSVQLFKNQTMEKSFSIHESAYVGKISLSQKYYFVGTKSRLIKLGVTGVQTKITGIKQIALFQEHFVYVLTQSSVLVLDFATLTLIQQIKIGKCSKSAVNQFGNLLAFYNQQKNSVCVYQMDRIHLARQFKLESSQVPSSLCFTADNKYLLSCQDKSLKIWSMIDNNLFKQFILEGKIVSMQFTADNQFFLSVFQNIRQINIWNNYIGKILSNRQIENLKFNVVVNHCEQDFRAFLKRKQDNGHEVKSDQQTGQNLIGNDILGSIPDSNDNIPEYKFKSTLKLLPLIYYDQIKQRNTIENSKEINLPFFLDFKNIDQEKKKIENDIKQDLLNKKKERQQKIDKHLKSESHQITLSEESYEQDFKRCLQMLESLSIAEIDYQLRIYLLNPINKQYLLKMFQYLYGASQANSKVSEQFKNILFHRALYLIGNQLFDQQLKEIISEILNSYRVSFETQKLKLNRCIAITEKLF